LRRRELSGEQQKGPSGSPMALFAIRFRIPAMPVPLNTPGCPVPGEDIERPPALLSLCWPISLCSSMGYILTRCCKFFHTGFCGCTSWTCANLSRNATPHGKRLSELISVRPHHHVSRTRPPRVRQSPAKAGLFSPTGHSLASLESSIDQPGRTGTEWSHALTASSLFP
jgi:hypothetical protein